MRVEVWVHEGVRGKGLGRREGKERERESDIIIYFNFEKTNLVKPRKS